MTAGRTVLRLLATVTILGALCLQGCLSLPLATQWHTREWSEPIPVDQGGWTGTGPQFKGPGLRFEVSALNRRESTVTMPWLVVPLPPVPTWKNLYTRPFAIQITFEPEDEGFTFDPPAVTLQVGDEATIRSSGFSRCARETETSAPFRLTQGTCVLVTFDREPPAPSQPFVLMMAGVEHHRVPVLIPPIKFEKVSVSWRVQKWTSLPPSQRTS
jgi:hypothetical protein